LATGGTETKKIESQVKCPFLNITIFLRRNLERKMSKSFQIKAKVWKFVISLRLTKPVPASDEETGQFRTWGWPDLSLRPSPSASP